MNFDQPRIFARVTMGVLLTACAGFVDAIGYIALGGLFASFMSGASVSLGVGLGDGDLKPVYQGILMVASFLGGVTLGTVLSGTAGRGALPAVLFVEALLLVAAAVLAGQGWDISTSILPVVAAMGMQNTILTPQRGVRLGVTFITGTLVSLGRQFGQALLGRIKPWEMGGHALLWAALVYGASCGVYFYTAFGPSALLAPATLLTLMSILAAAHITVSPNALATRRRSVMIGADHPVVWPYY